MSKVISVILPTSNRGEILSESIPLFAEQVERNKELIEFVVCDNASSDDSVDRIKALQHRYDWLSLVHYDKRVEDIGASIARSAENAHGDYILFWGDDDIPGPTMLDMLLSAVRKYPDAGCFMMNRIQAVQKKFVPFLPATNMQVLGKNYPELYTEYATAQDFIYGNAAEYGFLGAYLIKRAAWGEGMKWYDEGCFGYQFQVPLFCGLKGRQCIRVNYPMLIQRLFASPRYVDSWPLYLYVGLPRVYRIVQNAGVIDDWRIPVRRFRYPDGAREYINEMVVVCRRNRSLYLPVAKEIANNQASVWRKLAAYSILLPGFLSPLFLLSWRMMACVILPILTHIKAVVMVLLQMVLYPFKSVLRMLKMDK